MLTRQSDIRPWLPSQPVDFSWPSARKTAHISDPRPRAHTLAKYRLAILRFVRELFSFPNPVNEKAARVVAGVVLATALVILATSWYWLLIPLAYGFWARVLTGPTLSPLGFLAQRVIAPRLGPSKPVPGPPKRFAQGMGAVISTAALVLALLAGKHAAADLVLIALASAAGL